MLLLLLQQWVHPRVLLRLLLRLLQLLLLPLLLLLCDPELEAVGILLHFLEALLHTGWRGIHVCTWVGAYVGADVGAC